MSKIKWNSTNPNFDESSMIDNSICFNLTNTFINSSYDMSIGAGVNIYIKLVCDDL